MQDGQGPNQPGWVFKPGDQPGQAPAPAAAPAPLPPAPAASPEPAAPADTEPQQPPAPEPLPPTPEPLPPAADPQPVNQAEVGVPQITWTASEYAANPKSAGWFGLLALGSVLLAAAVYLLTEDIISTAVIAVVGVCLGVFAARQPRVLQYVLDSYGLHVGDKLYPYDSFKSFSVAKDQAMSYIQLMPLRRFMPPLTIHYDPADEDKIADTLAAYLPFEEHKQDMVDSLTRRFRL